MSNTSPQIRTEEIGLIGIGEIGYLIAKNLIERSYRVRGYRRGAMDAFAALGGIPAKSPVEVASECDVVVTCLPDAEALRTVAADLAKSGNKNLVVVELSTLSIAEKAEVAETLAAAGATMLDCPLSGIPPMVMKREAVIFASGPKPLYDVIEPVFKAMTDKVFYLGEFGVGSKMKFAANLLVGVHILAAAEALALGEKTGLDKELMVKVLSPSAGTSLQFQARAPMMATRDYSKGMAPHKVLAKDLGYIVKYADEAGCPSPLLRVAHEYFQRAMQEGYVDVDVASIYEIVAKKAGIDG